MILVGKLTEQEKISLEGQLVQPNWYFNPVLDGSNPQNWVITPIEMDSSIYPQNEWVKSIPLIEWVEPTNS